MSASLQGPKLNYPTMEKQAYAVCKGVNNFRPFLLKSHCIIFVSHRVVRSQIVQQEMGEKRENMMTGLQEYDLDIKACHIIKGHGLFRLEVEEVHA